MKYEELLCELFNCGQDGDELKLASATIYDSNINEIESGKGFELRFGLYAAMRKFQLLYVEGRYNIESFVNSWDELEHWIEVISTTNKSSDIDKIVKIVENLLLEIKREKN